jgi:hypothetical protein
VAVGAKNRWWANKQDLKATRVLLFPSTGLSQRARLGLCNKTPAELADVVHEKSFAVASVDTTCERLALCRGLRLTPALDAICELLQVIGSCYQEEGAHASI